eukprot:GFUD01095061.1.p1 GENE.GFUD01095061.1~~GFUD01095061.1.p1  ORF type:complete len:309 (+),score=91.30 GFUD01095061.1:36-962(+)
MIPLLITIYVLSQIDLSNTFRIVSYTQNEQSFVPGQTLSLTCKSNSAWEFCLWKHTNSDYKEVGVRDCLMEWKRAKGGVSVEKCHAELTDRVSISGDYDNQECGLTITGLEVEDGGSWECEMEEYKFGDWASGSKHSQNISVSVEYKTTTTTTTTATTLQTTTKTETTEKFIEYEVPKDDVAGDKIEEETKADDSADEAEVYIEDRIDDIAVPANGTDQTVVYDDDIEALPIEDREAAEGSSMGLIVGVLVTISALMVAAIVGGVFLKKKRRSLGVVALHKNKDDCLAANAFLEEAEYHISIIKDPEN